MKETSTLNEFKLTEEFEEFKKHQEKKELMLGKMLKRLTKDAKNNGESEVSVLNDFKEQLSKRNESLDGTKDLRLSDDFAEFKTKTDSDYKSSKVKLNLIKAASGVTRLGVVGAGMASVVGCLVVAGGMIGGAATLNPIPLLVALSVTKGLLNASTGLDKMANQNKEDAEKQLKDKIKKSIETPEGLNDAVKNKIIENDYPKELNPEVVKFEKVEKQIEKMENKTQEDMPSQSMLSAFSALIKERNAETLESERKSTLGEIKEEVHEGIKQNEQRLKEQQPKEQSVSKPATPSIN